MYIIIPISILLIFNIVIILISFIKTFYSVNKQKKTNDIILPNHNIYKIYKNEIINDIKEVREIKYKELFIKSHDGLNLYGRYFEYKKGNPIEIMFHGYRGNSENDLSTGVLRAFKCKRNVILVDQRASGKSDGHVITFGIKERFDCKNWVEYAIKEFGEDTKIIITGISMGAATVLMAASMDLPHNVIGVLADCGYDSPKNIIQKVIKEMKLPPKLTYPFVKLSAKLLGKFNIEEYSPVESVKNTNIPIIFIHGDKDSFVPHEMSIKMYNECVSEKKLVLIKDADHGVAYLKDPNTYLEELNSFFKNE